MWHTVNVTWVFRLIWHYHAVYQWNCGWSTVFDYMSCEKCASCLATEINPSPWFDSKESHNKSVTVPAELRVTANQFSLGTVIIKLIEQMDEREPNFLRKCRQHPLKLTAEIDIQVSTPMLFTLHLLCASALRSVPKEIFEKSGWIK